MSTSAAWVCPINATSSDWNKLKQNEKVHTQKKHERKIDKKTWDFTFLLFSSSFNIFFCKCHFKSSLLLLHSTFGTNLRALDNHHHYYKCRRRLSVCPYIYLPHHLLFFFASCYLHDNKEKREAIDCAICCARST